MTGSPTVPSGGRRRHSLEDRPVLFLEPLGCGGIADYTAALARALVGLGRKLELVTASDHAYALPPEVRVHGVVRWLRGTTPLRRLVRRARLSPVVNALRFVGALPRIGRLARRSQLVHVQGHYHPPLFA
ncbi:MAG: hypothetical protein M3133_03035, partial [Actinomycetota bacterium]|nr:hypothetical protein [Actinomycetota bacterium]